MDTREVVVHIAGKCCHIASDDDYLEHIAGDFEPQMVRLFQTVANGTKVVLDIGANIGCTAILFGGMAEQVHAFEPSPTTFGYLRGNVARNAGPNVALHNFGLGAEAGKSTITFAANNRSGAFVSDREKANADHLSEDIQIRTLDHVAASLELAALDFIKIDVEGFEGHVLRGGAATLARFRPVVVLELNHWCLNAFQRTSVPEFFDQLRATFPLLYAVEGDCYLDLHSLDESYAVMYHHILHMRFANILCAFDETQIEDFRRNYHHGMRADPPETVVVDAAPEPAPAPAPANILPPSTRPLYTLPGRVARRALREARSLIGRS